MQCAWCRVRVRGPARLKRPVRVSKAPPRSTGRCGRRNDEVARKLQMAQARVCVNGVLRLLKLGNWSGAVALCKPLANGLFLFCCHFIGKNVADQTDDGAT